MRKKIRYFNMLFFGLAVLTIFWHAVALHFQQLSPLGGNNHLLHNSCSHPEKLPAHCHSLDNLAIDNTENQFKKDPFPETTTEVVAIKYTGLWDVVCFAATKNFFSINDCLTNNIFLKSAPTRGSPVV